MAMVLRDGAVVDEPWPVPGDGAAGEVAGALTVAQWLEADCPAGATLQLEPGDDCDALLPRAPELARVAVHFADFMDGRGFSYARKLREAGFPGELRARGELLPDQAHYLRRCGFDSLEFASAERLEAARQRLTAFSTDYQAAVDQPLPLFRRRA